MTSREMVTLGGTAPGIQCVEAKDTVKPPTMHRTSPQDASRAEVEKLMKCGYFACHCIPRIQVLLDIYYILKMQLLSVQLS